MLYSSTTFSIKSRVNKCINDFTNITLYEDKEYINGKCITTNKIFKDWSNDVITFRIRIFKELISLPVSYMYLFLAR